MWNSINDRYEIDTEAQVLERLLTTWNSVNGLKLTINDIKGSGLEGVLYTYIRGYNTILQSGIRDTASFMAYNIIQSGLKVNRPNVIADNIITLGSELGVEVVAFDTNNPKLDGLDDGVYFVFKANPSESVLDTIFKSSVVVGTKTFGDLNKDVVISNGQVINFKYSIATELTDFRLKVRYRLRYNTSIESATASIRSVLSNWYKNNYKLGMNVVVNDITSILMNSDFPFIDEIKVEYSLNAGVNWTEGTYKVPYKNFVNIIADNIEVEVY